MTITFTIAFNADFVKKLKIAQNDEKIFFVQLSNYAHVYTILKYYFFREFREDFEIVKINSRE